MVTNRVLDITKHNNMENDHSNRQVTTAAVDAAHVAHALVSVLRSNKHQHCLAICQSVGHHAGAAAALLEYVV